MLPKTLDDCLNSPNKSLAGIRAAFKDYGPAMIMALLNVIISDLVLFFNVGKSMNDDQIKLTVQLIIDDYWYLKPDDFKLCFNNAKKGVYGKIYDRLDGQVILQWLQEYSSSRLDYSESKNLQAHNRIQSESRNSVFDRLNDRSQAHDKYAASMQRYLSEKQVKNS